MPDTVHHVMRYTVYDAKKSLPVRQHGQAQRVMSSPPIATKITQNRRFYKWRF